MTAVLLRRQFRALRASWATWALVGAAVFFAVAGGSLDDRGRTPASLSEVRKGRI